MTDNEHHFTDWLAAHFHEDPAEIDRAARAFDIEPPQEAMRDE